MSSIQDEIIKIKQEIPSHVRLVAVSKYHPNDDILTAYAIGQRIFGESQVQELQRKQSELPKDIEWHFIGHLQTNKVKYIVPYISLIHAVDSIRLLQEINKQAKKYNRVINCLLQLHIAQEETKFGLSFDECKELLSSTEFQNLTHIKIVGLMCMASNVEDEIQIRSEFHQANEYFQFIKQNYFANDPSFCECSWGMSDDYPLAILEGSTLIRVGSRIFGERKY